ncbi:hypothetical protein H072_9660 [Dactylellina haptotyla CBS 200.50]|uniref:Peptidase A1 domain-containing protein n=1 Tax=Dactylellina haptotyla (strain CBS 200.50) TaxID=1284197 RepID=S8A6M0_DACHA|nr:hypothetical protein H072_9660 [Dactylellina haptotyla CBS 200.50]
MAAHAGTNIAPSGSKIPITGSDPMTVTLGLVIAFHSVQCSVVIPYEFYGQGPYGVPDEFTRFGNRSSTLEGDPNSFTDYQSRYGVHLTIGTPPQDVWLLPQFYDSEKYVNDLKICVPTPPRSSPEPVQYCESGYGGLHSASTLGLGFGSTFINTFFPGHEQIGIYFTSGNSSYGNPPPMFPLRPTIVYEMDVGGFNMSRSTGPKLTSKIGPPNPISNTTNPFVLTVTDVRIGNISLPGSDEPYLATVDLSASTFDSFPDAVYNCFAESTRGSDLAAKSFNCSGRAYVYSLLPKDPKDMWNVTLTFSNGYNLTLP